MGAGQSADGAGRGRGNVQEIKTSYYELLSVERSATDEECILPGSALFAFG